MATAVMLMPALVVAAFTEAQTRCVVASAVAGFRVILGGAAVSPPCTRAE